MITIEYFSDVLCVWAWIAQRRVEELEHNFKDQIRIHNRYMDIFGAVQHKMDTAWQARGGYEGFAAHVHEAASRYDNAPVHADVWTRVKPGSSGNAHLYLSAATLTEGEEHSAALARSMRQAFFTEARDISQRPVLEEILAEQGLDVAKARATIDNGDAMASLCMDYQRAQSLNLRGSPSYVMNDERQILFGNVGYRVLGANVEELLKQNNDEASWC